MNKFKDNYFKKKDFKYRIGLKIWLKKALF
jgi:hypothetical protein